ncbi:hypothetical protein NIES593_17495 [Hydrococcus rivularis NIES-593]|uniref:DUF3038 domain-containing protein n=1 Tax=Hydrococcus rivularis NIES-593 TaxID=1921803 RepID=A0A1U7HBA3_9CYAN|nr:DUF3038 domain-containing protein [Hydrococcus rivularis]OKH20805.1 hypothetical protein NIES593_17495 [Hydrococcus rivularis NIES-593]
MGPSANAPLSTPKREDLPLSQEPDAQQLDNIKAHLDIILMALEALTKIGSEEVLKTAQELKLESIIADRVGLWRLRQSNPLRKSSGGRKKLDVEEARSLVLIICYLARGHHELIRRAVTLLEQITEQNKAPHQTALLGDYLDAFTNSYQERMEDGEKISTEQLSRLALKLLIDLLFYSAVNGHRRLWLALLDSARQ